MAPPSPVDAATLEILSRARHARYAMSREDVNVFAGTVLRKETTGERVKQADLHRRMQDAWSGHDRVVTWGFVESGKSSQMTARLLWELGRDPTLRIAYVSRTQGGSQRVVQQVAKYIKQDTFGDLRAVFPNLLPGSPWRENAITVQRRTTAREPSLFALGVHGAVLGARLDRLILDDIVDFENSNTAARRDGLYDWIQNTLLSRLVEGARVIVLGNAYHPEDAMHRLAALSGWRSKKFPVIERGGVLAWPEVWNEERIKKKRAEVTVLEFARSMMCEPRSEEDARFRKADIEAALNAGVGLGLAGCKARWRPEVDGAAKERVRFYTGVDLAFQMHASADYTCLFTIAVWQDGIREVVDIQIGRWTSIETLTRIKDTHRAWDSVVVIENVSGQDIMRQFAAQTANVPVVPYTTGRGQANLDFQAEALAAEIANGRWIIPKGVNGETPAPVQEWIKALLYYTPSTHTPDVMAASLFARWRAQRSDTTSDMRARVVGDPGENATRLPGGRTVCWG